MILVWLPLHNGVQPVKQVQRWSIAERERVMILMPSVIGMYNTNIGGVHRLDQNVAMLCIAIRGKSGTTLFYHTC